MTRLTLIPVLYTLYNGVLLTTNNRRHEKVIPAKLHISHEIEISLVIWRSINVQNGMASKYFEINFFFVVLQL